MKVEPKNYSSVSSKSFLSKEANHVKGFAKECAIVTHSKLKTDDIKIIKYKGALRKVAEFPASITKKGKKDYVIITEDLQKVLDQIEKINFLI